MKITNENKLKGKVKKIKRYKYILKHVLNSKIRKIMKYR